MFKQNLLAVLAFFALSAPAHAVISYSFGVPPSGTQLETFDSIPLGSANGTYNLSGFSGTMTLTRGHIVQGTTGTYAKPYQNDTRYVSLNSNGSALFSLSQPINYFGIQWGSVDTYNSLSFYNGSTLLGTIVGQTIITAAGLNAGNQGATGTVYANFLSTQAITSVLAFSSGIAFEFDNIRVAATPLPAALAMFAAAFGGLGVVGRRRRAA